MRAWTRLCDDPRARLPIDTHLSSAPAAPRRRFGHDHARPIAGLACSMAVASHLALLASSGTLFVKFGNVPKFVMPSPVDTAQSLFAGNYNWWGNSR